MSDSQDDPYQERLGVVLRRRDPAALRAMLLESARRWGDDRQVADVEAKDEVELLELMHRMILARQDLVELHPDSLRWLHGRDVSANGLGRGS